MLFVLIVNLTSKLVRVLAILREAHQIQSLIDDFHILGVLVYMEAVAGRFLTAKLESKRKLMMNDDFRGRQW